jgi:hypothetical protein
MDILGPFGIIIRPIADYWNDADNARIGIFRIYLALPASQGCKHQDPGQNPLHDCLSPKKDNKY